MKILKKAAMKLSEEEKNLMEELEMYATSNSAESQESDIWKIWLKDNFESIHCIVTQILMKINRNISPKFFF